MEIRSIYRKAAMQQPIVPFFSIYCSQIGYITHIQIEFHHNLTALTYAIGSIGKN